MSNKLVPNEFPQLTDFPYKIAIVGEAPGAVEEEVGKPFSGESGRLLDGLLGKANIMRKACFVGNICQTRPTGNVLTSFDWSGPEIQSGIQQLRKDLATFKPNIVLCLGGSALHVMKEPQTIPIVRRKKKEKVFVFPNPITNWRGSLFKSNDGLNLKCISSYHPAACLVNRKYEWRYPLLFDIKKMAREARSPDLVLPVRTLVTRPSPAQIISFLTEIWENKTKISIDIEGGIDCMSCISIATSPTFSMIVPFRKLDGSTYFDDPQVEIAIWTHLNRILSDSEIEKILQNSLYDRFVLTYSYRTTVANVSEDTMLKHWELYCELEKSLGFQTSLYTDEPYYKSDIKSDDQETFFRYCCKDSAITYEISEKLTDLLGPSKAHYNFNIDALNVFLYMELRGMRYDIELSHKRLRESNQNIYRLQFELDRLANVGFDPNLSKGEILNKIKAITFTKDQSRPYTKFAADYALMEKICLSPGPITPEEVGFINISTEKSMNIRSPIYKTYLYEILKLPEQRDPDSKELTSDYEALLKLRKHSNHRAVTLGIELSALRTRSQMLKIKADKDGRIRAGYNVVGGRTGRVTCYTSPTGSGWNLHTIPDQDDLHPPDHPLHRGMKDLILADPDHFMANCDLKGSDGWTIGAHLDSLGAPEMLEDLYAGVKPASRVCYMLRHGNQSLKGKSLPETKELLKEVKKEDWDYFACKIGIWGICYLMGPDLLANQILEESAGKIALSRSEVQDFHEAVFTGYRVKLWHSWMSAKLSKSPTLVVPSGHVRRFFGRPSDILGNALAHEPQANTTYATNMAARRLWFDPENRTSEGRLKIEPLHQVHDSLVLQFHQSILEWAKVKIKQWFDNPIIISGHKIIIPYDGSYGTNWAMDEFSKKGTI